MSDEHEGLEALWRQVGPYDGLDPTFVIPACGLTNPIDFRRRLLATVRRSS